MAFSGKKIDRVILDEMVNNHPGWDTDGVLSKFDLDTTIGAIHKQIATASKEVVKQAGLPMTNSYSQNDFTKESAFSRSDFVDVKYDLDLFRSKFSEIRERMNDHYDYFYDRLAELDTTPSGRMADDIARLLITTSDLTEKLNYRTEDIIKLQNELFAIKEENALLRDENAKLNSRIDNIQDTLNLFLKNFGIM